MSTVALFTTRAFSSDFKSLYESMHFLRKYDRIVLVHAYKTDQIKDYVERVGRIKVDRVVHVVDYFLKCTQNEYPTWRDLYDDFPGLDEPIDAVYMFGAPQSDGGGLKRHKNGLEKNLTNNKFITFQSVSKLYCLMYIAVKTANVAGAVFNEMCYDPGENSVAQLSELRPDRFNVYHGYDIPHLEMQGHTWYQDGLSAQPPLPYNPFIEKHDVVFGYSYMTKERKASHELAQKVFAAVEEDGTISHRFMVKNKLEDVDTSVGKDEYMSLLQNSRFTFIAPAYAKDVFSCSRYMEALYYGCLPLVFDNCRLTDFFETYDVPINKINGTIINPSNAVEVLKMDESRRLELVQYLREKIFVL